MAVSKTVAEQLPRIKKNISSAYIYFQDNYKRFHEYRRYVFKETVNDQQRALLTQLSRPVTEFNILEAYLSRLIGEFSKHEPSISVSPSEGKPVPQEIIDIVEGHLRYILYRSNKNSFAGEVYKDMLSGGFSVAKIYTDYTSSMSFHQQIYLERAFDPTLCGFDPMARDPHKGDGQYCFELVPMTLEDFKREFPEYDEGSFKFARVEPNQGMMEFSWSYKDNQDKKIVLVGEYYEKKKKRTKIVQLANKRVMTVKDYEKMQKYWEQEQVLEQIPIVVGNPRTTTLEYICHYRLVESGILSYKETDFSYLPLVFMDGNSVILTHNNGGYTYQMTRPYIYHAKGIQDMTNYSGQTICNSMENLIQHKFILMKEAIPQEQDYIEALNDIQQANTIVVNAYSENNPEKPIPNPIREVQNVPLPPEVVQAFNFAAPMTQAILGSFASNLGKNDNDLSGKAVIESSTVGNAAAMPCIIGYIAALSHIGCILVDLMPKYILGERELPVLDKKGDKDYKKINGKQGIKLNYEEQALSVNIEAGVNFQVQKNQAVEQIIGLMHASEELGAFFNSEKGLKILAKNLTIYGADNLEEAIDEFLQTQAQQKQQAMQMQQQAMQNDPAMIRAQTEMMKIKMQEKQNDFDNQIAISKQEVEKILADAKLIEAESKVTQQQIDSAVRLEEAETSAHNHAIDAAAKIAEIHERQHAMELKNHEAAMNHEKHQKEMRGNDEKEVHVETK